MIADRRRPVVRRPRRRARAGAAGRHQRPRRPAQPGRHRPPRRPRRARRHRPARVRDRDRSGSVSGSCCAATAPNAPPADDRSSVANGQPAPSPPSTPDQLAVRLDHGADEIVLDRALPAPRRPRHPRLRPHHPPRPRRHLGPRHRRRRRRPLPRSRLRRNCPAAPHENWLVLTDPEAAELHRASRRSNSTATTPASPHPTNEPGRHRRRPHRTAQPLPRQAPRPHPRPRPRPRRPPRPHPHAPRARSPPRQRATQPSGSPPTPTASTPTELDRATRHASTTSPATSPSAARSAPPTGTTSAPSSPSTTPPARPPSSSSPPTGSEATRTFDWADLRLVDPPPTPGLLPPAAQQRLDAITDRPHRPHRATGRRPSAASAPSPATPTATGRAIERHVERHAHTLAAETARLAHSTCSASGPPTSPAPPPGTTPCATSPAGGPATNSPTHIAGLGDRPDDPEHAATRGTGCNVRLGLTRTWLATTDRIHPADTIIAQLRRTPRPARPNSTSCSPAPPPTGARPSPSCATGQLTLDDTADLLRAALDGQASPAHWILANWPHVVEYQEINRTLTTGTWGPDPQLLTDLLTRPLTDTLAAAIERDEPWLRVALSLSPTATPPTSTTTQSRTSPGSPTVACRRHSTVPPTLRAETPLSTNVDVHADVGSIELDVDI